MKIVVEYDPWSEITVAKRTADALTVLGIPTDLREVRARHYHIDARDADPAAVAERVRSALTAGLPGRN